MHLVAYMDDQSRFIVAWGLHASSSDALVREVFEAGVARFGVPEEVLTFRQVTIVGKPVSGRARTCHDSPRMDVETCWTLIRDAADGQKEQREEFARRYLPAVRAILEARWQGSPLAGEVEDAVQEVFVACFREGGALGRTKEVTKGFRSFLYGVTRNVALQVERSRARRVKRIEIGLEGDVGYEESGLSRLFDREYARAIVREALETMERRAKIQGEGALKRFLLLLERTDEGKPIREIAREWSTEARGLHLEEAKARREFRSALRQVVGLAERCAPERVNQECERLLDLLE